MNDEPPVTQLYPQPGGSVPLRGLYLSHDLRGLRGRGPFVYTNYVTSLDGRIGIARPDGAMTVPSAITNDRDWRLFQELAVQADVIITSGRYLRDYAAGRAQEILRVYDKPQFADLGQWRIERGLSPLPDLAVVSGSLDFPIPPALVQDGRRVSVFTHGRAPVERMRALESQLGTVVVAGEAGVDGAQLVSGLGEMGYRTVYMATGPKVHHLLLAADAIDRLYLTLANRLLGGEPFSSVVEGDLLRPPVGLRLQTLYHDPHALDGLGQLFLSYSRSEPS